MEKFLKSIVCLLLLLVLVISGTPAFAANKIDLNSATVAQLVELKGIGEKTARQIVDYREKHKFTKVDDLMKIKGIGEKKLLKIKDQLVVGK